MKGLQLWSGTQHTLFCRESRFVASYTRDEGGGSQKVTNDDEGDGGVTIPSKIDDVIYEQPLTAKSIRNIFDTAVIPRSESCSKRVLPYSSSTGNASKGLLPTSTIKYHKLTSYYQI